MRMPRIVCREAHALSRAVPHSLQITTGIYLEDFRIRNISIV